LPEAVPVAITVWRPARIRSIAAAWCAHSGRSIRPESRSGKGVARVECRPGRAGTDSTPANLGSPFRWANAAGSGVPGLTVVGETAAVGGEVRTAIGSPRYGPPVTSSRAPGGPGGQIGPG